MLDEVLSVGGDVDDLAAVFGANAGYLNVGLRMLCSQGILQAHRGEDKVNYMPRPMEDVGDWVDQKDLYTLAGRGWSMPWACGTTPRPRCFKKRRTPSPN